MQIKKKLDNRIELKNKILSAFFHILIMSIFEIIFYFFFIIKIERKLFLDKIMFYNQEFKHMYLKNISPQQNLIITNMINSTYDKHYLQILKNNYEQQLSNQKELFTYLLHKAIFISCIIFSIFLLFFLYSRKIIKIKWIIIENILLFLLLGLYEFLFLNLIILKYYPVTDAEIEYLFVCNSISLFNIKC